MDEEDAASEHDGDAAEDGSRGMESWDTTIAGPNEGTDDNADEEEGEGNVAGALAPDLPVEPQAMDLENVVFVALGAYLGVLLIMAFVGQGGSIALIDLVAITVAYVAVVGLAYGFFTRANPDT